MKSIVALAFVLISLTSYSQTAVKTDSKTTEKKAGIKLYKDVMTDKEYLFYDDQLLCSEDGGKYGFLITPNLKFDKQRKVAYAGLMVKSAGIGSCVEKDILIFLFDDGTKHSMTGWNDFNCKGSSYFDLYNKDFSKFNSKRVKAIRFQNGRTHESYTYTLKPEEQNFFILYDLAILKQEYVTVDNMD